MKAVLAACALAGAAAAAAPVRAQDATLEMVRNLYAAAAYEDALRAVDKLLAAPQTRDERRSAMIHRVLCLVALGRTAEADRSIEALVLDDALFRPSSADLPPRVWTAFNDARKRLLPDIIRRQYLEAKIAFDRKDFATAAPAFAQVLEALGDPDLGSAASHPPLADLRTLAVGFHDLSMKAMAPPPPPPPPPSAPAPAPAAPARDYRRVYTVEDRDVVPPIVVRQEIPPFPGKIANQLAGVLDVLIDATGAVESVTLRPPLHPRYDRLLLSAAERWQYRPATVDGVPVRFLKRVQVTLAPSR
ncbi:MAG TPA: energy transducer TonB [Vicinamibacterales bacterium]|nr:energy transducer TonB [Vicinamibacterales bacterium]